MLFFFKHLFFSNYTDDYSYSNYTIPSGIMSSDTPKIFWAMTAKWSAHSEALSSA